jgi:hypothetical protein
MWKMTVFVLAICVAAVQAQPAKESKRRIDLIALFSPDDSPVEGEWISKRGKITSGDKAYSRMEFPFLVPDEYDYNITFSAKGKADVLIILSMRGKQFLFLMGNPWCLEYVGGKGKTSVDNPTRCKGKLQPGKPVRVEAKIRSGKVDISINGELKISYETDGSDLGENNEWLLPHRGAVGIGCYDSPVEITSAEIVEISGKGTVIGDLIQLRPPK